MTDIKICKPRKSEGGARDRNFPVGQIVRDAIVDGEIIRCALWRTYYPGRDIDVWWAWGKFDMPKSLGVAQSLVLHLAREHYRKMAA